MWCQHVQITKEVNKDRDKPKHGAQETKVKLMYNLVKESDTSLWQNLTLKFLKPMQTELAKRTWQITGCQLTWENHADLLNQIMHLCHWHALLLSRPAVSYWGGMWARHERAAEIKPTHHPNIEGYEKSPGLYLIFFERKQYLIFINKTTEVIHIFYYTVEPCLMATLLICSPHY